MNEPEQPQPNWHEKTWIRVLALLLIPLIAVGLYLITTSIALRRPTAPVPPETSVLAP